MVGIRAWASHAPKQELEPYVFAFGPPGIDEVEVAVKYCGLCHSDLSMINSDWGLTQYSVVSEHEIVGRIVVLGSNAKGLRFGQKIGIGWNDGLSRMSIKFTNAWGREVTVLTSNTSKETEAKAFGAQNIAISVNDALTHL